MDPDSSPLGATKRSANGPVVTCCFQVLGVADSVLTPSMSGRPPLKMTLESKARIPARVKVLAE